MLSDGSVDILYLGDFFCCRSCAFISLLIAAGLLLGFGSQRCLLSIVFSSSSLILFFESMCWEHLDLCSDFITLYYHLLCFYYFVAIYYHKQAFSVRGLHLINATLNIHFKEMWYFWEVFHLLLISCPVLVAVFTVIKFAIYQ